MSYRIGRGETGVLTYEPYKSLILPNWRFKTVPIAQNSSSAIYAQFLAFNDADDFIGMDMARKFLQMGMTRAKRYANHAGGRKYDQETGRQLQRSEGHKGREEKLEASGVFREAWERAKGHDGYQAKKERFIKEQKEWDKMMKKEGRRPENACVKGERLQEQEQKAPDNSGITQTPREEAIDQTQTKK
jgi:hypothetical protein